MHLADAFIQSDLQCIQAIHFFISTCVPWEMNPQSIVLLTQCSTTEPQEYLHGLMMLLYYSSHPDNCIHSTEFLAVLCYVHSSPALLQLPRFPTDPVPCFPDCWAFCHQHFTQAFQFGSVPVQVQLCVFLQLMKHFRPAFIQRHVWAQHRVKAEIHIRW